MSAKQPFVAYADDTESGPVRVVVTSSSVIVEQKSPDAMGQPRWANTLGMGDEMAVLRHAVRALAELLPVLGGSK